MQAHTLLGFHITTNPDGCTHLVLHAHDHESARIYRTDLHAEPHVADALRMTVLREIPHRPLDTATTDTLRARLAALSNLTLTCQP